MDRDDLHVLQRCSVQSQQRELTCPQAFNSRTASSLSFRLLFSTKVAVNAFAGIVIYRAMLKPVLWGLAGLRCLVDAARPSLYGIKLTESFKPAVTWSTQPLQAVLRYSDPSRMSACLRSIVMAALRPYSIDASSAPIGRTEARTGAPVDEGETGLLTDTGEKGKTEQNAQPDGRTAAPSHTDYYARP